jgi:O-antigen ligase
LVQKGFSFPQNISQRIELSFGAASMISHKFLLGEGLNTFVINESRINYFGRYLWTLQPVHNIFLLIFSETGVIGLLYFYFLLNRFTRKALLSNGKLFCFVLVFVMLTGLVDHYWFTLQQNMFFLTFVLGNSFGEES